jgi:myosin protein heavy chain
VEEGKVTAEKMCKELDLADDDYRIGFTKVFFRAGVLASLEERRDQKLSTVIVGLQVCLFCFALWCFVLC